MTEWIPVLLVGHSAHGLRRTIINVGPSAEAQVLFRATGPALVAAVLGAGESLLPAEFDAAMNRTSEHTVKRVRELVESGRI